LPCSISYVGRVALPTRLAKCEPMICFWRNPQVADVEVELVARRRAADHDLAERLHGQHGGRERGLAEVLEDDVGLGRRAGSAT